MAKNIRKSLLALSCSSILASLVATAALAQAVIVERPMPRAMVEVIPAAPSPTMRWVPGHWVWRGFEWVWVKGHYVEGMVPPMPAMIVETRPPQPSPQHFWVQGHYAWENNGWNWHRGVWVVH